MVGGVDSKILMRKILITQLRVKEIPFYTVESSKDRIEKLENLLSLKEGKDKFLGGGTYATYKN